MIYAVIRYKPSSTNGILEMITTHDEEAHRLFRKLSARHDIEPEKYKGWRVTMEHLLRPNNEAGKIMTIYSNALGCMDIHLDE